MKRTVTKLSSEPASDLVIAPKVTDRLQSYRSPEPASDLVIAPKVTDRSHCLPLKLALASDLVIAPKVTIAPIAPRPKLLKRYKNQCFCDLRL